MNHATIYIKHIFFISFSVHLFVREDNMKINLIGYNHIHDLDFNIIRPSGSDDYLALLIKSPSYFTLNGVESRVSSNTFFLYKKNTPQYYRACDVPFSNDWFHFAMNQGDLKYINSLKIPFETFIPISDIAQLSTIISSMSFEQCSNNEHSANTNNHYLHIFFNKVSEEIVNNQNSVQNINHDKLKLLRTKIYNKPYVKWSIEGLAHEICLSPYYFQRIYKEQFNTTCLNDIINARIEYAKYKLQITNLPIRKIAEQCGYENDVHFMRQFKQKTGFTPTEYRKNHVLQVE